MTWPVSRIVENVPGFAVEHAGEALGKLASKTVIYEVVRIIRAEIGQ